MDDSDHPAEEPFEGKPFESPADPMERVRQRGIDLDMLNELHTFPGPYIIKAIGRNEDDFVSRVVRATQNRVAADGSVQHTVRETPGGRHVAVTLTAVMQSAEEVLEAYDALRDLDGLVQLF